MSTYANVTVSGHRFCVSHSDHSKKDILEEVREVANRYKGKVKSELLPEAVLNALIAGSHNSHSFLREGVTELAECTWDVRVGPRGGISIKGRR